MKIIFNERNRINRKRNRNNLRRNRNKLERNKRYLRRKLSSLMEINLRRVLIRTRNKILSRYLDKLGRSRNLSRRKKSRNLNRHKLSRILKKPRRRSKRRNMWHRTPFHLVRMLKVGLL